MKWRKLNGQPLELPIKDAVKATLEKEIAQGHKLKVCIGTDSQVHSARTEFATVIVFLREKKGGFMYINKSQTEQKMGLKERMITEVGKSIEIAYALCDLLDQYDVGLEVHADINTDQQFKSHVALKEAMGYIKGMGFEFKMKPDAFASSSCADKLV